MHAQISKCILAFIEPLSLFWVGLKKGDVSGSGSSFLVSGRDRS